MRDSTRAALARGIERLVAVGLLLATDRTATHAGRGLADDTTEMITAVAR